jgi:hypothetical protein
MKYLTSKSTSIYTLARCLLLALMAVNFNAHAADTSPQITEKVILGWIENVEFLPWSLKAKAKLDTGAKTSSIHAKNIEYFDNDGESWVRFQFANDTKLKSSQYKSGKSKKVITIETPLARSVLIKHHKHSSVERPAVNLPFSLAGVEYTAQFTLTDRSKFLYPVLLGRRFLKDVAIVDPSNTFLLTRSKPKQPEIETTNDAGNAVASDAKAPDSNNKKDHTEDTQ